VIWALAIAGAADLAVYEALLTEQLDPGLENPIAAYKDLVRSLPPENPDRAQLLTRQADLEWARGDLDRARELLDGCIRAGVNVRPCQELRGAIDLEDAAIRTLPTVWSFDTTAHGMFHPWAHRSQGSLKIDSVEQEGALIWTTTSTAAERDQLVVAVNTTDSPTVLSFRARARREGAVLGLRFEDRDGNAYAPTNSVVPLPVGAWADVVVDLSTLAPTRPPAPAFDPSQLYVIRFLNASGLEVGETTHEIAFDELRIAGR